MTKQTLTVRIDRKKILVLRGSATAPCLLPGQSIGGSWHHRAQIAADQIALLEPEAQVAALAFNANNARSWNKLEHTNLVQNSLNRSVLGTFKVKFVRPWKLQPK